MKPDDAPYGTRTRVLALRGLRPGPLDERGQCQNNAQILANGRIPVKELFINDRTLTWHLRQRDMASEVVGRQANGEAGSSA